jgi:hypothetical protein
VRKGSFHASSFSEFWDTAKGYVFPPSASDDTGLRLEDVRIEVFTVPTMTSKGILPALEFSPGSKGRRDRSHVLRRVASPVVWPFCRDRASVRLLGTR